MVKQTLYQSSPIFYFDAMKIRRFLCCLATLCLCAGARHARADLVVVTSEKTGIGTLRKEDVINIYLGRYRRLANGMVALPVDMDESSVIRQDFYWLLVRKTPAEINAYWARLVFSGQTMPPAVFRTRAAVVAQVLKTPGTIGYLHQDSADKLDNRLVVVFEFKE